tara:strand:- start:1064 stop:1351 length:288 start_codon:yes stop_codon:yes gene_type:complete
MARTKIVDGVEIELTTVEEAQRDQEETDWNNDFDRIIKELRDKRNKLLAETDYFALSDISISDNMIQYRKDLRDITNGLDTVEKINAVVFPTKPN